MDSRAKQRITGAVILVAVFVLLVPELLKGPDGKPGSKETAAAPDEAGLRSYTIDIDAPAKPAQAGQVPEAAVELPTPSASTPMAMPGEAAVPEPETPEPATPAAVVPMAVASVPAPARAPTSAPETEATSPARAPTPPAAAPAASGGFAVQLGSFSSRDNANRLVREMTAKGFAAFVAPITSNGRELFRVRVGPARDRAGAEALATQLRRIGQTGSIVSVS
ncbi:MAG: SPOR domain-containing protein [Steroidobacteraceae bacterium]|nr:SPOR domain-containing protein [Steroidobacteraceae bacterium]